jgi:hypothetical protein
LWLTRTTIDTVQGLELRALISNAEMTEQATGSLLDENTPEYGHGLAGEGVADLKSADTSENAATSPLNIMHCIMMDVSWGSTGSGSMNW